MGCNHNKLKMARVGWTVVTLSRVHDLRGSKILMRLPDFEGCRDAIDVSCWVRGGINLTQKPGIKKEILNLD